MIHSKEFFFADPNKEQCLERALREINTFIRQERIRREDIIEYRTIPEVNNSSMYTYRYKIILSWWK